VPTNLRCPRCLAAVRPPSWRSPHWHCDLHGEIVPLHPARVLDGAQMRDVASSSKVPAWLPWPLPPDWVVTGLQRVGDEREGTVATVLALTGPNPFRATRQDPLTAELLVVAEQPGIGLGPRLAGTGDIDPGPALAAAMAGSSPHATVEAGGHAVPLWCLEGAPDRAAYVGEAASVWLWLVVLPAAAGALALDGLRMLDLRDPGHPLDVPAGALTPLLR
jgi:hypothetical protein